MSQSNYYVAAKMATCTAQHKSAKDFIPLIFVLALVAYTYVGFVVFYLRPMLLLSSAADRGATAHTAAPQSSADEHSFVGSPLIAGIWLLLYHIILVVWAIDYARCIFSDAGTVPDAFRIDGDADDMWAEDEMRQSLGIESVVDQTSAGRRVCTTCQIKKPPRTHHCSLCKRCVLKMDHHCPWVINCVGFGNYKFFVLFLFWSAVLGLFVAGALAPRILTFSFGHAGALHQLVTFVTALVFGIGLAMFCGTHVRMLMANQTTLESMSGRSGSEYDVGTLRNVRQVLGDRAWLWLLPVASSTGDGVTFAQARDARRPLLDDA